MSNSTVAELIASQASSIMGAKYISAFALSCLLYDSFLHFDDELADIWLKFRRGPILRSFFILGRYSAMVTVGYEAISLGVFNVAKMTTEDCGTWIVIVTVSNGISLIGTEGIVIYRLRSLWHFNSRATRVITAMVIAVFISIAVSFSVEALQLRNQFIIVPGFPGCLFNPSSPGPFSSTVVIGTVLVIWDIFNLCIFTCNTFATPYLCTSDVLQRFRRDGGRYFLCLLVVHIVYLLNVTLGQNSRLSTHPLVTALTAIINARIFHGIASEAERYADEYHNAQVALPKVIGS